MNTSTGPPQPVWCGRSEKWDEQRVEKALFGERQVVKRLPEQVLPDFPALHAELQQHPHLTLQLAWELSR